MQTKANNLLIIISDEHRKDATGCAGHPIVQTPNLDALAARGTLFENAYTPSPMCVPTRAALACGDHVHRIGHWDSATPYDGKRSMPGALTNRENVSKILGGRDACKNAYVFNHTPTPDEQAKMAVQNK